MGTLGDIIFWGAIIIAVISQVAKSFKKANASAQNTNGTVRPQQLINPPQRQEVLKPPPLKKNTRITGSIPKKEILKEEEDEFEVIETSEFSLTNLSEAKKAIIYSEILNRKY